MAAVTKIKECTRHAVVASTVCLLTSGFVGRGRSDHGMKCWWVSLRINSRGKAEKKRELPAP